ncbi:MAG: tetratricopeptide repeat protein, partial [Candidatus Omnitrophota bacterium]
MLKRSIRRGIVARILAIASGLFLFLILLELGLRLAGFGFLSLQERRNRLLARQKGRYTIMCVGESTTAVGGAYSYPSQLQEILNQRRIGVRFSVINKGVPGIHTSEILNRFGSDLDAYHPDMVISMMGSGDSGPHMPYEVVVPKAMNFFRSFKVYKLALSLGSRIAKGLKAAIPGKPGKNTAQQAAPGKADRRKSGTYPGRGWAYERQGRYPDAEAAFKEAIEADPGNALAYLQLGWFYRAQGKFTEAEGLFKKAIKLHTGNGRPYSGQGGFAEAQAVFKNSIELNPDDYWSYIGLGWIALEEARYSQAEDLFSKAVAVNPANDWLYVEM